MSHCYPLSFTIAALLIPLSQVLTDRSTTSIPAAMSAPTARALQIHVNVTKAKNDMRSLAAAIETYFLDSNSYPPATDFPGNSTFRATPGKIPVSSFTNAILTTPIAYILNHFPDPFGNEARSDPFGYYVVPGPKEDPDQGGWLLFSPGPDAKYDLDWRAYDPAKKQPTLVLLKYTYDPTNGTISSGDIWRSKIF